MEIFLAMGRVQYEGDELIGVYSTEQKAEFAIAEFVRQLMQERLFDAKEDNIDEFLENLCISFEVDRYNVDGGLANNYGLTHNLLKELLAQ